MHELLLLSTGLAAGVAGPVGGVVSLVSFPALLLMNFEPLAANVTNTVGVVTVGTLSSSLAYRRDMRVTRRLGTLLVLGAALGGLIGAALLLWLGKRVFEAAVPMLLVVGAALIIAQPFIVKRLAVSDVHRKHLRVMVVGTVAISIYAGYFGAGAGVLIFGLYAVLLNGDIQRANALKSLVSLPSNLAAAIYFTVGGPVDWSAAAFLAVGSFCGGYLGVHLAKRLPNKVLRILFAVGGVGAALYALH